MKPSSRTILAAVAFSLASVCYAQSTVVTPDSGKFILKKKGKDNPVRTRMPSMNSWLTVDVHNGVLTVEFPNNAETGIVTISTGTFPVYSTTIDRTNNTVDLNNVPELYGEFFLTVNFDNGDDYEGGIGF